MLTFGAGAVCHAQAPADLPVTRLAAPGDAAAVPPRAAAAKRAALLPLPVASVADRAHDLDSARGLTIACPDPTPIRDVVGHLVRDTPFGLVIDADVQGTFVGTLKDLTLRDALSSILDPLGFGYAVEGTTIHVSRARTETRFFDLDVVDVRRSARVRQDVANGGLSMTSAAGGDRFAEVTAGIEALLSDRGRVHIDRRAGVAQVTDDDSRLDRIGLYLEAVETRRSREVRLQARVLDVRLHDGAAAIDWRAVRRSLGVDGTRTAGFAVRDIDALQGAIAAQGDLHLVAAPDVVVLNNEPAVFRTGAPTDVEDFSLTVVPQIGGDGVVQISVSPSWTASRREPDMKGGTAAPVDVMFADTVLRIADGDTAVISGFLRAPQAGGASTAGGDSASGAGEVVLLLTPTVVGPGTFQAERSR